MGRGILKKKKSLKLMYLNNAIKEIERLQAENQALKTDPASVVGKFINEFNEVVNQNQRLSALACALITQDGGKSTITRDEIEAFKGKRLRVQIDVPEEDKDVKFEEAKTYIFSFTATTQEEDAAAEAAAQAAKATAEVPECTDPNCTLPKDLKHTHDASVIPTEEAVTTPLETQQLGEQAPEVTDQSQQLGEGQPELVQEASAGATEGQ
jgi:hypothetical protein